MTLPCAMLMRGSLFRIRSFWSEAKDLASARVPPPLLLTIARPYLPLRCIQDDGVSGRYTWRQWWHSLGRMLGDGENTDTRQRPIFPEYLNDLASIPHS